MKRELFLAGLTLALVSFSQATCTEKYYENAKDFSAINVAGACKVFVTIGQDHGVTIEGSDEDIEKVQVKVHNNTLFINRAQSQVGNIVNSVINGNVFIAVNNMKLTCNSDTECICKGECEDIRSTGPIHIYITLPMLRELNANSGTKIALSNLENSCFILKAHGGSVVTLSELSLQEFLVEATSGSTIELDGTTETFNLQIHSGSIINAAHLCAQDITVNASSGSTSHVYATDTISIHATSGAAVAYSGNPHVTQSVNTGASVTSNN